MLVESKDAILSGDSNLQPKSFQGTFDPELLTDEWRANLRWGIFNRSLVFISFQHEVLKIYFQNYAITAKVVKKIKSWQSKKSEWIKR